MQPGSARGGAWENQRGNCARVMLPMSGDDSANSAQGETFPVKGRVWAVLLLGFCCWHSGFLIASIVPRQTGEGKKGNPALNLYRTFISGDQHWNMFETIPLHRSLDAWIEVDDGKGGRATLGSVLPGFTPYPSPENTRYYNLFYRIMLNAARSPYFGAYLRRTDGLLRARYGSSITGHWALVVDVECMRPLHDSRRDGVPYVPATGYFDAANPGGVPR